MTVRTEHLVLAGAVLMDLQLANRIDTDLDNLTVSNPTPLGDDVLDPTLADIVGAEKTHDALYWVERTARRVRIPVKLNAESGDRERGIRRT